MSSSNVLQVARRRLTPLKQPTQQPRSFNNGYLPNGTPAGSSGPVPGAQPLLPNQGRIMQSGPTRILCVADVRGIQWGNIFTS